jgi:hypothetical protein
VSVRTALVAAVLFFVLPATGAAAQTDGLAVRASLVPVTVRFGDPLTARVDVSVDGRRVDPASVRIGTEFTPYRLLRAIERDLGHDGDVATVTFRVRLQCLEVRCIGGKTVWKQRLPSLRVFARSRGGERLEAAGRWPVITVRSRTRGADANSASLREELEPPPVSYRVSPTGLALVLGGGATALLLLAVALLAREVRRARRARLAPKAGRPLSAIEYALARVREAVSRTPPDRRKALGLLARSLRSGGDEELASDAVALAWSPPQPSAPSTEKLVERIEHELRGGS